MLLTHKFLIYLCADMLSPKTTSILKIMFVRRCDFAGFLSHGVLVVYEESADFYSRHSNFILGRSS